MRTVDLTQHRVKEAATRARGGAQQLDVLRKERDDDELAGRIFRPLRGTVEQVPSRPPALPVGWREEQRFDAAVVFDAIDFGANPRCVRAPTDHLRVITSAWRVAARDEMDRLQEVGLAGPIRSDKSGGPTGEGELDLCVAAEVLERECGDAHSLGRDAERHHHVKVVGIADDLDDTWRERPAELKRDLGRGQTAERVVDEP